MTYKQLIEQILTDTEEVMLKHTQVPVKYTLLVKKIDTPHKLDDSIVTEVLHATIIGIKENMENGELVVSKETIFHESLKLSDDYDKTERRLLRQLLTAVLVSGIAWNRLNFDKFQKQMQ